MAASEAGEAGEAGGTFTSRPTQTNKPLVRTRFNGRRIMFEGTYHVLKWTPVKPKKNQTARDQAAKKPKNQTLAPKMMEKEMAEEEKKFQALRGHKCRKRSKRRRRSSRS